LRECAIRNGLPWSLPPGDHNIYADRQLRAATPGDAFRLCSSVIPNVEGVTICVRKQKASLTAGCKTVFDKPIVTTASTEKAPSPD
jgi:hypothetical protein